MAYFHLDGQSRQELATHNEDRRTKQEAHSFFSLKGVQYCCPAFGSQIDVSNV